MTEETQRGARMARTSGRPWLLVGVAPLGLWLACASPGDGAQRAALVGRETPSGYFYEPLEFTCHQPPVVALDTPTDDLAPPSRPIDHAIIDAIQTVRSAGEQPRLSFFGDAAYSANLIRVDTLDAEGHSHVATFLRGEGDAALRSDPVLLRVDHPDEGTFDVLFDPSGETTVTQRGSMGALTEDALGRAVASLAHLDGLDFPWQMPPIRFPEWHSCNAAEERESARAWAMAHHHAWRTRQLFMYLDANPQERQALWSSHFDPADAELDQWSPRAWFGVYRASDYTAIRGVVEDVYHRMRNADIGGIDVRFKCTPVGGGNVCNSVEPVAHHWVIGWVNACESFFNDGWGLFGRAHIVLHEMLHHTWVHWTAPDGVNEVFLTSDVHQHAHGPTCSSIDSESMIGVEDGRHLADNEACFDRELRLRNVDSYARMLSLFGRAVYDERIAFFPTFDSGGVSPPTETCGGGSGAPPSRDTDEPCVKLGQQRYCWDTAGGNVGVAGDNCLLSQPTSGE